MRRTGVRRQARADHVLPINSIDPVRQLAAMGLAVVGLPYAAPMIGAAAFGALAAFTYAARERRAKRADAPDGRKGAVTP